MKYLLTLLASLYGLALGSQQYEIQLRRDSATLFVEELTVREDYFIIRHTEGADKLYSISKDSVQFVRKIAGKKSRYLFERSRLPVPMLPRGVNRNRALFGEWAGSGRLLSIHYRHYFPLMQYLSAHAGIGLGAAVGLGCNGSSLYIPCFDFTIDKIYGYLPIQAGVVIGKSHGLEATYFVSPNTDKGTWHGWQLGYCNRQFVNDNTLTARVGIQPTYYLGNSQDADYQHLYTRWYISFGALLLRRRVK